MPYSHREDFELPSGRSPKLFQPFTIDEWNASNYASAERMQWFRDARYGMFIHFGLSAYSNANLSWGVCYTRKAPDVGHGPVPDDEWQSWPREMQLEKFDARQWVRIAEGFGFKYLVMVAKHHDGFHMWDTDESEFKITNTPCGRDVLGEVISACQEAGMPVGIYYSQRDWYHPDYMPVDPEKVERVGNIRCKLKPGFDSPMGESHVKYKEYQMRAVRELCTHYGKIDIFWWDAVWWGGMFTAEMWDAERLTRMVRELQPDIIQNNRCCVPGDFDTPEQQIGMFQDHRPWESCMCLCKTWSYSDTPVKTPKQIVEILVGTLGADGNTLLSWGPKWSGEFDEAQIESLRGAGAWIKKNAKAIYETRGGPWRPADWGGSVHKDRSVYLHVVAMPVGNKLELEGLKPKVLKARIHGDSEIPFTQEGERLQLTIPNDKQDPLCTVVELTLDSPITEIIESKMRQSTFESPGYGRVILDHATLRTSSVCGLDDKARSSELFSGNLSGEEFALRTDSEPNPYAIIDLGGDHSIRGIHVANPTGPISQTGMVVSLSVDGNEWETIWKQTDLQPSWDIPVTSYVAGAHIPGKNARFVKIERTLEKPDCLRLQTVKVFGY